MFGEDGWGEVGGGGELSWINQDGRNQKGIFSTISPSISNKHFSLLQTFKLRTLALKGPQAKLQVGVKLHKMCTHFSLQPSYGCCISVYAQAGVKLHKMCKHFPLQPSYGCCVSVSTHRSRCLPLTLFFPWTLVACLFLRRSLSASEQQP